MDFENVTDVAALATEFKQAAAALELLDHGAQVAAIGLAIPEADRTRPVFMLGTADFHYPPEMIYAIRQQIAHRQNEIEQRLIELGVGMSGAR